jgi:hypothetical protein
MLCFCFPYLFSSTLLHVENEEGEEEDDEFEENLMHNL